MHGPNSHSESQATPWTLPGYRLVIVHVEALRLHLIGRLLRELLKASDTEDQFVHVALFGSEVCPQPDRK